MKGKRFIGTVGILLYLLGIHEGYIALWLQDQPEPVEVFPYRAALLPAEDRTLLESGIVIGDGSELANLLEDYLS